MENINKYKTYKNLKNKICRCAKTKYTKEIFTEQKNDAKKLWMLINSSIGRESKKGADIPNFFRDNNVIFDNFRDIAEGFNNFFINIGQKLQKNYQLQQNPFLTIWALKYLLTLSSILLMMET